MLLAQQQDSTQSVFACSAQANAGLDTTTPSAGAGQSGLLALDGTGSGGGVYSGGDSISGQGASPVGGGSSAGVGDVSGSTSFGNPGGLVFDGAGNIVSGVQSAFGDVPSTYTGRQVIHISPQLTACMQCG